MLEEQLAADMATMIVDSAKQIDAMRVVQANVLVGSIRDIDEALFKDCLAKALEGTIGAGADISVVRPALTMRCMRCGTVYPVTVGDKATYDCPSCGSGMHTVETGAEFAVDDMQVLLPAPSDGPSMADKLAKAVEDAFGPVEKPAAE